VTVYDNIRAGKKYERLDNPDSYNEGIRNSWLPFWTKNAAENYAPIKGMFEKGNCDVMAEGQDSTKPVLIIGSGPSLNDMEPYLKDWDGDIFVSSSQLAFFEAIGVKPSYCFIIDADPNMSYLVSDADTKDITLITHPNMDPEVLKAWEGPVRFFRMNDPGDDWFGKYMPMMYEEFFSVVPHDEKVEVERDWQGGSGQFVGNRKVWPGIKCFVLNSGNVSNTMIALSQFMGPGRNVFLCGVDLGFPLDIPLDMENPLVRSAQTNAIKAWNRRAQDLVTAAQTGKGLDETQYEAWKDIWKTWRYRFHGYKRTKDGFEPSPDGGITPQRLLKEGHNGVKTDQVSCFYKYSTLILWGMDAPHIYSCSRGILDEIPYISPQDVVACQGDVADKYKLEAREKYKIAQEYLRHRGIYIMKGMGKTHAKKATQESFERSKKRIIRYMIVTNKIKRKGKMTPEQVHQAMDPAPMIKFRLKWWEWTFGPEERVRQFLGYLGITNKYHVKGIARWKLMIKFYLGKAVGLW
jgi:hypothetical protein